MVFRFSPSEVLEMAVELERRGIQFYRKLQMNASPRPRELFAFLEEQEKKHLQLFTGLRESLEEALTWSYDEEAMKYLGTIVENGILGKVLGDTLPSSLTLEEAIEIGIQVEKESVLFYQGFYPLMSETKHSILEEIIAEEKRHVVQLTELKKEFLARG